MKRTLAWILLALAASAVAFLGATPVEVSKSNQLVVWNGPKATPDTVTLTGLGRGAVYAVDYIYVSNIAGGTATSAKVVLKRFNGSYTWADSAESVAVYEKSSLDTLVVFQTNVPGGPGSAPMLAQTIGPNGGLYMSDPGDTLKVIVTMASASSLYVACGFHDGR